MPPTLKKLMGHIAFGACVRAYVTLFVPTVTFKQLKLESWNFICGFLIKIANLCFFLFRVISPFGVMAL